MLLQNNLFFLKNRTCWLFNLVFILPLITCSSYVTINETTKTRKYISYINSSNHSNKQNVSVFTLENKYYYSDIAFDELYLIRKNIFNFPIERILVYHSSFNIYKTSFHLYDRYCSRQYHCKNSSQVSTTIEEFG